MHHVYYLHTYNTSVTYLQLQSLDYLHPRKLKWNPTLGGLGRCFSISKAFIIFFRFLLLVFRGVYMFSVFHPGCKVCFFTALRCHPYDRRPDSRRSVAASRFRRPGIVNFKAILRPAEPRRFFWPEKMVEKMTFCPANSNQQMDGSRWVVANE